MPSGAHRGAGWSGKPCRGCDGGVRRRSSAERDDGVAGVELQPSDPLGSTPGGAVQRLRGVRGAPESPTARKQGGGLVTCSGGSGEIPGEVRTGVEGCGLGKLPGHGTELLHGSAEA